MARFGVYSPDTARMILDVVKYLKESGFVVDKGRENAQAIAPSEPIYIRNDSGATIPAWGCVQASGTVDAGGQTYVKVTKVVDILASAGPYLFNTFSEIPNGEYGIASDGPVCRMLTDGSAVTCGDRWKPVVGAYTVTPGGTLFCAIGSDAIGTNVMIGKVEPGIREHWIGYLMESYRGVVIGFWVTPSIPLDGVLPTGDQYVYNIYKWNFGIIGGTVRVEKDLLNNRWVPIQQEYICDDNRSISPPTPPP
jgi:hypothetical protein